MTKAKRYALKNNLLIFYFKAYYSLHQTIRIHQGYSINDYIFRSLWTDIEGNFLDSYNFNLKIF